MLKISGMRFLCVLLSFLVSGSLLSAENANPHGVGPREVNESCSRPWW